MKLSSYEERTSLAMYCCNTGLELDDLSERGACLALRFGVSNGHDQLVPINIYSVPSLKTK